MGANMNQPEEERKKLAQLREQFALKAQLQKEYQDYANKVHPTRQMTFNDWLAQRNGMAKGGLEKFPLACTYRELMGCLDVWHYCVVQ